MHTSWKQRARVGAPFGASALISPYESPGEVSLPSGLRGPRSGRRGNGRASEEIAATLFPLESEQESTRCTNPFLKITPSAGITEGLWKQEVLSNLESS